MWLANVYACVLLLTKLTQGVRPNHESNQKANGSILEIQERESQKTFLSDPVEGSAGVAVGATAEKTCEQINHHSKSRDVCSVDEFLSDSWLLAIEVACQVSKVQNVLDLLAEEFRELDGSRKKNAITQNVSFDQTQECPHTCTTCVGQRHYTMPDGRPLLLLPQPVESGNAYGYKGGVVKPLTSSSEIVSLNETKINEGLQYATNLQTTLVEQFILNEKMQSRIRYFGNDPAILFELPLLTKNAVEAPSLCIGGPNQNIMVKALYQDYFSSSSTKTSAEATAVWSDSRWDHHRDFLKTVATRPTFTSEGKPMGTIALDVNLSNIVMQQLEEGSMFNSEAYGGIVSSAGRVIAMSQHGREHIFKKGLTAEEVLNPHGIVACLHGMPEEALRSCSWETPKALSLHDTLRLPELYSGANFSELLTTAFDGNMEHTCSSPMRKTTVNFPGQNRDHIISFCILKANPDWAVIFGSPLAVLTRSAKAEVDRPQIFTEQTIEYEDRNKPNPFHWEVVLKNTGNVSLPWKAYFTNAPWLTLAPMQGRLAPGGAVEIDVQAQLGGLEFGSWVREVFIEPLRTEAEGTCWPDDATKFKVAFQIHETETFVTHILHEYKWPITYVVVALFVILVLQGCRLLVKRHYANLAYEASRMEAALNSTSAVAHPMVVMKAGFFKSVGKLFSHEDGERMHALHWLYSVDEVKEFVTDNPIVFVSHQWTAFGEPDPDNVQYVAMVMSIDTLIVRKGWKEDDVYLWVDYASIPQKHRGLQTLAINSLTSYAAHVAAFVVVAPMVTHKQLQQPCDKETYQLRAWCRAEQLAHFLAVGADDMYLAEGNVLSHLTPEWLEKSAEVFHGNLTCCQRKHKDMLQCDKQLLVIPMLGLWAQLCMRCDDPSCDPKFREVHHRLEGRLDALFPTRFTYITESGERNEQLFGNLLSKLPYAIRKYQLTQQEQLKK